MEHKIFNKIRKYKLHFVLRLLLTILFFILGLSFIVIPVPGSALVGWGLIIIGMIFIIKAKNISNLIKIRKGIFYGLKNIHDKNIREHKVRDIKKHIKQILNNKKI